MLFVIFVSGGVLLGTSAIVADVGAIYAERGELQGGADSAAMAVAEDCAKTPTACAATAQARALTFGNGNARDGAATITVCGRGVTPVLPTCAAAATNRSACVQAPPATGAYVEVRASTRQANNSTLLPPSLARGLAGNGQYDGVSVKTCARAGWGTPAVSTGLAFTTSLCEWSEATSAGTNFAPSPPTAAYERSVYVKGGPSHSCPGVVGHNAPGNFGWLDDAGGCTAVITYNGSVGGDPGASAHNCDAALAAAATSHAVVYLPIYDTVSGNGSHTTYHMMGVAAFVITGYSLPGSSRASWLTGSNDCGSHGNSDKCLLGYYTKVLKPIGGTLSATAPALGVSAVSLTG
jgi:hypothetical protein